MTDQPEDVMRELTALDDPGMRKANEAPVRLLPAHNYWAATAF